jgi:hypothetical protein
MKGSVSRTLPFFPLPPCLWGSMTGGKGMGSTQFRVGPALGDSQARGRARGDCFRHPRMVAYRHRDG